MVTYEGAFASGHGWVTLVAFRTTLTTSPCVALRTTEARHLAVRIQVTLRRESIHHKTHTHTRTHPFNGPLSRTTRVGRYQKGKTNLDFTEARDSEWQ